ncbi:MAG: hypothetical protein K0R82_195 [Flavipsychrobacter sp.]|nr:hypothetical protein [Flavipsychrobacter sp.]
MGLKIKSMKKIVFVLAIFGMLFASCANERETVKADPQETGYPAQPHNSSQQIMQDN